MLSKMRIQVRSSDVKAKTNEKKFNQAMSKLTSIIKPNGMSPGARMGAKAAEEIFADHSSGVVTPKASFRNGKVIEINLKT